MKRLVALAFVVGFLAVTLTGCAPRKGDNCEHRGDTYSSHGLTLNCNYDKHRQLVWQ